MDRGFVFLLRFVGVLATVTLLLVGLALFAYGAVQGVSTIIGGIFYDGNDAKVISLVLKKVDIIFLGLVIVILGIGIFELFVTPLTQLPSWLIFKDFDQLKLLLIKASVTVIGVSFTGRAVTWSGDESIAYYGLGIAAIIASLTYFIKVKSTK